MDELNRRLQVRNEEGVLPSVPITAEQLAHWATFFEAPDKAEMALFDPPMTRQ